MKRCPHCGREYDLSMSFCLDDGAELLYGPAAAGEAATAIFGGFGVPSGSLDDHTPSAAPLAATRKNSNSIAVLPFANISDDPGNEYFCDGLAEELLNALAKIDDLKVAARTSAFSFKGKNAAVGKIGLKLGVGNVLEGSVRKSGDRLRISAQLVDASNGYHLWSERYDREMHDIFDVQDEIALAIVDALKLKLLGGEKAAVLRHYTADADAHQLFLKGRFHYAKRTRDDTLKGIGYFQQAIDADPNFALAYAWIADSYASMPAYPHLAPNEAFPESQAAARRALEIDPTLAEAHTAMAYSLALYEWNWAEADRHFKRAMELDPDNYELHYRYGLLYLAVTGRKDESIAQVKRALEIDPLSLITGANLVLVYLFAGRYELGLEQARKTFDLEPNFVVGRYFLGLACCAGGMYSEAIELAESYLHTDPANQLMLRVAGLAHARSGDGPKAEAIIEEFAEIAETQYAASYYPATIYAALGDRDNAFRALEKAFKQRDWELHRLKVDPFIEPLRGDPRYAEMLTRLNLPQ